MKNLKAQKCKSLKNSHRFDRHFVIEIVANEKSIKIYKNRHKPKHCSVKVAYRSVSQSNIEAFAGCNGVDPSVLGIGFC